MSIFTNWIFWIVLSTILFGFALLGFLTDKKKNSKDKNDSNLNNPSLNNSTDILDSVSNNTFNLESPVQEEVNVVSEPVMPTQEVKSNSVDVISEPLTGQNDTLNILGGNQDNVSFMGNSSAVQFGENNSLNGDLAIRNQVNLNSAIEPSNNEEAMLQFVQPINGQVNSNVAAPGTVGASNSVSGGMINGQGVNPMVQNVQAVNGVTNSGAINSSMMPQNGVVNIPEMPINNTLGGQPMPVNNAVNTTESSDNSEKIYDTWS